MTPRRPHPHTLTGAYALHALTGPEAARFERHLASCPSCAQEVGEFGETAARMAVAAAAPPSAALRRRVMAAVARTRQLPPVTRERAAARIAWPAPRAGAIALPVRRWLALTAAAVVLALAGVLALVARAHQPAPDLARDYQIAAVLTAPDATMLDTRVTTGGTATIVMSLRQHRLVFAAARLAPLPASRCYELWLIGPRADTPAGMLPESQDGSTGPVIAAGLWPGTRLGLTVEPAGGSARPTGTMILDVAL